MPAAAPGAGSRRSSHALPAVAVPAPRSAWLSWPRAGPRIPWCSDLPRRTPSTAPSSTVAVRVWSLAQISLGRAVRIVPVCGFSAFGNMRDGASNWASRISRSTCAFDVRTSWKTQPGPTLCDGPRRKTEKPRGPLGFLEQRRVAPCGLGSTPPEHSPRLCGDSSLIVKTRTRQFPFVRHAHHAVGFLREGRSGAAHGFGLRQTKGRPASRR